MKKLAGLMALMLLIGVTFSSYAQMTTKSSDSVNIIMRFMEDPGKQWLVKVYQDATSDNEAIEINNEGWMGPVFAAGDRKIRIGTNYLDVKVKGTWELLAYTDHISRLGLPDEWDEMDNDAKALWVSKLTGLYAENDLDNDGEYGDLFLPIKVRSEGVQGYEDVIDPKANPVVPYNVGDVIGLDKDGNPMWDTNTAQFSYLADKSAETLYGQPLTRIGIIGATDLVALDRIQVRYGINEAQAGKETYKGTIYYELRGN